VSLEHLLLFRYPSPESITHQKLAGLYQKGRPKGRSRPKVDGFVPEQKLDESLPLSFSQGEREKNASGAAKRAQREWLKFLPRRAYPRTSLTTGVHRSCGLVTYRAGSAPFPERSATVKRDESPCVSGDAFSPSPPVSPNPRECVDDATRGRVSVSMKSDESPCVSGDA